MANRSIIVEVDGFFYNVILKDYQNSFVIKSVEKFDELANVQLQDGTDTYFNCIFNTTRRTLKVPQSLTKSSNLKDYILNQTSYEQKNDTKIVIPFESLLQSKHKWDTLINFDLIEKSELTKYLKFISEQKLHINSLTNFELSLPLLAYRYMGNTYNDCIFAFQLENTLYLFILNGSHCEYIYRVKLDDNSNHLSEGIGYILRTYSKTLDKKVICLNDIDTSIFNELKEQYDVEVSSVNIFNQLVQNSSQDISKEEQNIVLLSIATLLSEKTDANLFLIQRQKEFKSNLVFLTLSIAITIGLLYQTFIAFENWNKLHALKEQDRKITKKLQVTLMGTDSLLNGAQLEYLEQLLVLEKYRGFNQELQSIINSLDIQKEYKTLTLDKTKKELIFSFEFKSKDSKLLYELKNKLSKQLQKSLKNDRYKVEFMTNLKTLFLDVKIIYKVENL